MNIHLGKLNAICTWKNQNIIIECSFLNMHKEVNVIRLLSDRIPCPLFIIYLFFSLKTMTHCQYGFIFKEQRIRNICSCFCKQWILYSEEKFSCDDADFNLSSQAIHNSVLKSQKYVDRKAPRNSDGLTL